MRLQSRGIALLYAMIVASLTAILAISFVIVNRSNLSLVNSARQQREAYQAAVSGFNYARMRLETSTENLAWGLDPFTPATVLNSPGLTVYEDGYCVVGVMEGGGSHFQVYFDPAPGDEVESVHGRFLDSDIRRNPSNPAAWSRRWAPGQESFNNLAAAMDDGPLEPEGALRHVAPGAANLVITGTSGGITRLLDVTVRQPHAADGSLLSGGALALDFSPRGLQNWSVESLDPFDNKVRSNGVMAGPSAGKLVFGDGDRDRGGEAVSKETIVLGADVAVSPTGLIDSISGGVNLGDGQNDEKQRAEAGNTSKGSYLPNSNSDAGIPDISPGQLKKPPAVRKVAAGRYHFIGNQTVAYWPDADHYQYDYRNAVFYQDTVPATDGGTDPIVLADFNFIVLDGNAVEFDGDTRVSTASYYGSVYPAVAIGYTAGAELTDSSMASVRVQGNLQVEGAVVGAGSIITEKNAMTGSEGNLTIGGKSALSVAPDYGVAIYADGAINMQPIPDSISDLWKTQPADWDVFQNALNQYNQYGDGFGGGVDNWLDGEVMDWQDRQAHIGADDKTMTGDGIRDQVLDNYDQYKEPLTSSYPAYEDPAVQLLFNDTVQQWQDSGGISLGRHVRLREFLKQASLYKQYGMDERYPNDWLRWASSSLDLNNKWGDYSMRYQIDSQIRYFAQEAEKKGMSLSAYFDPQASNPLNDERDIDIKGIVYAGKNFFADVAGYSFNIQGALMAREGPLVVTNADDVNSIFDPKYLDALLEDDTPDIHELETVYWSMR